MTSHLLRKLAFGFAVAVATVPAFAVQQRSFVASTGIDTNACTLGAPCRTFGAAIAQTSGGGEIVVLDSAGYGTFTINKAITVTVPSGIYAGITANSAPGIVVSAGASDVVNLVGLTINSQNPGTRDGIQFLSGHALHVKRGSFTGLLSGIYHPNNGLLFVTDSYFSEDVYGISIVGPAGGQAEYQIDRVNMSNISFIGLAIWERTLGSVRDSTFAAVRNAAFTNGAAIAVQVGGATNGDTAYVTIDHCHMSGSYVGILLTTAAFGRNIVADITNNVANQNKYGLAENDGQLGTVVIRSLGNNMFDGSSIENTHLPLGPIVAVTPR
jgi:hypothetical protein